MALRLESVDSDDTESLSLVRQLFLEYAKSLDFDLDFQDFDGELANLPGDYSRPYGRLLIAYESDLSVGCAALRRIDDETCEMKRLYVRPGFRGMRIGRALAQRIIDDAREIGYARMRLDTVRSMTEAISLYKSFSFHEIGQYRVNPHPDALFFELDLTVR